MREEMAGRVVEVYSLVLAIVSVTCTVYCNGCGCHSRNGCRLKP